MNSILRYIGTDFIFYLLSPIYLLSFDKSCKLGLILSVATIVTSAVLNIIAMEQFKYPPTQFIWITPNIFNPDFMEVIFLSSTPCGVSYTVELLIAMLMLLTNERVLDRVVYIGIS